MIRWPLVLVAALSIRASAFARSAPVWQAAGVPTYGASGVGIDPNDIRMHGEDARVLITAFDQGAEHIQLLLIKRLFTA